jgi:hypothetical protein
MNFLGQFLSLAGLITEVVIFVTCLSYLRRSKTVDSQLLFIGSIVGLIVRVCYVVLQYVIAAEGSNHIQIGMYYSVASMVSLVGSVFFCIGLVLLIQRLIKSLPANPS